MTTTSTVITGSTLTYDTTTTFSTTKPQQWWTIYVRENGENLWIPTITTSPSYGLPLESAGSTATSFDNRGFTQTSADGGTTAGGSSGMSSGRTILVTTTVGISTRLPSLSLNPDGYANYSIMAPDASVFPFRWYGMPGNAGATESLSLDSGWFDATKQDSLGATTTSRSSYSASTTATRASMAERILPRIVAIAATSTSNGLPVPVPFVTSVTDSAT